MVYTVFLSLHLLGVILLFSSYIIAFSTKAFGEKSQDRAILAHVFYVINRLDSRLTPVSIVLIVITGVGLAQLMGLSVFGTNWLVWSLVLWGLTGLCFALAALPIQRKLETLLAAEETFSWERYHRLARQWMWIAVPNFILTIVVLAIMVYY